MDLKRSTMPAMIAITDRNRLLGSLRNISANLARAIFYKANG